MGFALSPVTAKRPNFCPPAVYFWSLAFPFFGCALSRPPPLPAREIFAAGTHATADGTYEDNAPPPMWLEVGGAKRGGENAGRWPPQAGFKFGCGKTQSGRDKLRKVLISRTKV